MATMVGVKPATTSKRVLKKTTGKKYVLDTSTQTEHKVNREFIEKEIANELNVSFKDVDSIIGLFFEKVFQHVMESDAVVSLKPFGKFEKVIKKSRAYTSPTIDKKKVVAPAKEMVIWRPFRAGKKSNGCCDNSADNSGKNDTLPTS